MYGNILLGKVLLNGMIQEDPGAIVGPISTFMGWIIDFVFNLVYPFTEINSLGISIIILTLIMRFVMLPLAVKSQKSMIAMQKLTPEVEKIKQKYGNTKDPELMRKMNAETQALYSKNKVNPLSGCLPLLIQMPIFFALNYLMNQSFMFIGKLRDIYHQLAGAICDVPHWTGMLQNLAAAHVPNNMMPYNYTPQVDPATNIVNYHNLEKILNRFSAADWDKLFNGDPNQPGVSSILMQAPRGLYDKITSLYTQKQHIEMFFGLNMLDTAGWAFPGIIIPILTVLTTFLTSWLSMKVSAQNSKEQSAVMQQRIMMFAMPLVMGFFTVSYPIGVGIYWITSSIFQVVQQIFLNQRSGIQLLPSKKEDNDKNVG